MADQLHLDYLKKCIANDDIKKWNKWRAENSSIKIDLSGANFIGFNLNGTDLRDADLSNADLFNADLFNADLRNANLFKVKLIFANLQGANLQGANLQGANHQGADLQRANLQGAHLIEVNLQGANLQGADLQGANLYGADLQRANLQGAHLKEANLYGADLRLADFKGANLSNSVLNHVICYQANFHGTNLTGAILYNLASEEWDITEVECDYIYTDERKQNRLPKVGTFGAKEFERRFKSLPSFEIALQDKKDIIFATNIADMYNKASVDNKNLKLKSFDMQFETATFTVLKKEDLQRVEQEVQYIHLKCLGYKKEAKALLYKNNSNDPEKCTACVDSQIRGLKNHNNFLEGLVTQMMEKLNQPQQIIHNHGSIAGISFGDNNIQHNTQNGFYAPQPNEVDRVITEIENADETIVPINVKSELLKLCKELVVEKGKGILLSSLKSLSKAAFVNLGISGLERLPELSALLMNAKVMVEIGKDFL